MEYKKHFVPLESDPIIFTSLMRNLGVLGEFKFIDIWSIEKDEVSDIRATTQKPVDALVLVIPDCPAYAQQEAEVTYPSGDVVWLKQTINNACGLYAILHCVCNTIDRRSIVPGSFLHGFMQKSPNDRAEYLESSSELDMIYHRAAVAGSSQAPAAEMEVEHHYICFVKHAGCLYELDGDRTGPIYRGRLADDEDVLSQQSCDILKKYMDSCPDGGFSMLALTATS